MFFFWKRYGKDSRLRDVYDDKIFTTHSEQQTKHATERLTNAHAI